MNRITKLSLLIVSALFFLNVQADPIKDLIKNSPCSKDYPSAKWVVLFDSAVSDMQQSGLTYVYTHQLFKVLNEKGAKDLSVIKYGYDPLSAYVEIQKVVVHKCCGGTEVYDLGDELDYPAPARMIYWGAREKMIEIGRLEPGDAVEVFLFKKGYTYALLAGEEEEDERYIPPMRGHFYDIVPFWNDQPMLEKVYIAKIPENKLVQYEFYNGDVRSSVHYEDGMMVYNFTKKNIIPVKSEPRQVASSDVAPKLLISTSPDWEAKSLWFYGVNEDYGAFISTPEIDKKVAEIVKDAKTELDTISLLTHWCADEIRYSGISMGEGEGYTLHNGEMNFTDRCGVCKDKASMLVTMLRAAGFESYPAMTMAGSRIDYIPADQFNHSVTVVKRRNGEYQLLDPTWVPFLRELWSSAEQQQNYLMGVPEGADLMITPISPPENHYVKMHANSKIDAEGKLTGHIYITAEGQSDGSIRGMFTRYYKSEWQSQIENELLAVSPNAKLVSVDYDDPYEYLKGPIEIDIEFEIPNYAVVTDEALIFTPITASGFMNRAMGHMYFSNNPKERKHQFRDRCSRLVELKETVKLPAKYVESNLESKAIGNDVVWYNSTSELKGRKLEFTQNASYGKRIYDPEDWPWFRDAVEAQKNFAHPVILTK